MKCLETGIICPTNNLKCKECKFKNCRRTIEMVDYNEKRLYEKKLKLIREQLPIKCRSCSFLEVINLNEQKVRCPYMVKDKCLLKK